MTRPMAQAWHTPREPLTLEVPEAKHWRAKQYVLFHDPDDPTVIEAVPEAFVGVAWESYTPFDSYRPTSKTRRIEDPHLKFLVLKGILEKRLDDFYGYLIDFANEHGLLGAFEEDYLPRPITPPGKGPVAPEAVIDDRGRLRRVDPATEGKELLLDLLEAKGWSRSRPRHDEIALPSEVEFVPRRPGYDPYSLKRKPPRLAPWEVVQEDFGALLVLDEEALTGVSVLCTREPIRYWRKSLRFFPPGDTPIEDLVGNKYSSLNSYLEGAWPYARIGEDGNLERGWRCRSLLQAMYVMLYLDLTEDDAIKRSIKKCQSRGCPYYYREGPQPKNKYCTPKCANRASTRMSRGQEP